MTYALYVTGLPMVICEIPKTPYVPAPSCKACRVFLGPDETKFCRECAAALEESEETGGD